MQHTRPVFIAFYNILVILQAVHGGPGQGGWDKYIKIQAFACEVLK